MGLERGWNGIGMGRRHLPARGHGCAERPFHGRFPAGWVWGWDRSAQISWRPFPTQPLHRADLCQPPDPHPAPFPSQICVLECEGQAVPRATWELCAAASRAAPRPRHLSAQRWPGVANSLPLADAEPQLRRDEEEEEEDISRRLGAGRAAKGVQKRYGGFIGVRKSARKWNNQKRFSEFLKQYLGMAPRSSEYGPGAGAGQNNEI